MLRLKLRRLGYALARVCEERSGPVLRVFFACLAGVSASCLLPNTIGHKAESELLRTWFWLRGARSAPADVLILSMDTRTKQALGVPDREPVPRSAIAVALERLAAVQPKAIIFDAVFEGAGPDPATDQRLAEAFKQTPSVIAMSSLVDVDEQDELGNPILGRRRVASFPLFVQSVKKMVPMLVQLTGNIAQKIALSSDPTLPAVPLVDVLRTLVDPSIPAPGDDDLIDYYGPPFTLRTIPMHKLFAADGAQSSEQFREKVILVGWMDRSINGLDADRRDSFLTPMSHDAMYGVEIHATIAANLLERRWLRRFTLQTESVLVFVVTFIGALLAASLSARRAPPIMAIFVATCLTGSYAAFVMLHRFIPSATACVIVLPAFVLLAAFAASRREERNRRELQKAIGMATEPMRRSKNKSTGE